MHTLAFAHVEPAREGREGPVCPRDPGLRLHDGERALGHADRVTPFRLLPVQALPDDAAALERVRGRFLEGPHDLDEPLQVEHRLAALDLELAPEPERLLRQPHVLVLGVGEPEDPRAPVAGAVRVADLELLVDDGLVAAPLERLSRGEPHHARADDRDFHRMRFFRIPMPSISSSTSSPGRSQRSSPCSRMQPVPTQPEPITSPGRSSVLRAARSTSSSHSQCMSPRLPRERSSPLTRATISRRRSPSSSGVTTSGPSEVAKSFPFAGPSPIAISLRCRSRADQSFITVNPPISPSVPITAATSSS